ncbi:site-specific DNA-cytosine methylase [Streptacidiphilus sp. BW17]|uniref:DNA cytosine methyltransferase n=1 Tax=Streptacidiphilus sp. BW17 TaxID=3156274 RepID=UPI003513A5B2
MSYLYPRLLSGQAKALFEEYRGLSVSELTGRARTSHDSAVYVATGGDRVAERRLKELRGAVETLALEAGFPDRASRADNTEFDVRLARLLHDSMGLVPAEAASRDVWAFLSLVLLPDIAYWRYPSPPRDRVLGTDLTRHVFGRMWWRAQLVYSPEDEDPYASLRILGEAAFDQIYARRAALGGSPHMVKAILKVWNEIALTGLTGLNERETLRDFLKRLLRLAPFVLFDGVEASALEDELRAVLSESVTALLARARGDESGSSQLVATVDAVFASTAITEAVPEDDWVLAPPAQRRFTSVEVCAGAGGQALGLERAGFDPVLLIDNQEHVCRTLGLNRPRWDVRCGDVRAFDPAEHLRTERVDLLSGGLPRIRSAATSARADDVEEREVFEAAVNLVARMRPKAVLLENMPEFIEKDDFAAERSAIEAELTEHGYHVFWRVLDAADFGVPQHRRSGLLVALAEPYHEAYSWPAAIPESPRTVGEVLGVSMASGGWPGATEWATRADKVGPALVGGSDRRGGADLGPTGSKNAWAGLGVNGNSLGDTVPEAGFPPGEMPKLTVRQAALLQCFPEDWGFEGGKTKEYRQIGHAMPPPLATAVGRRIAAALA